MQEALQVGELVRIGRFSQMTRLSVKALRLYSEMDLLQPVTVDESSGYRYYSPHQADRAEAIRVLRAVDMPLDQIRRVLISRPDGTHAVMVNHQQLLTTRLERHHRMLAFLGELIDGETLLMPYEVTVKNMSAHNVLSLRREVSIENISGHIASGFGQLMQVLEAQNATPHGDLFIVFHDVIDEETSGEIELGVPVAQSVSGDGPVEARSIKATRVASTTHRGRYMELAPAYRALMQWITKHGYDTAGPPRETYLNDPTDVSESELLTEVAWPITSEVTPEYES